MTAIIDMQGFKGPNNQFIVKEIAVLYKDNTHQHFIVQPPYDMKCLSEELQKQVIWLYHNYHGLSWNGGSTTLQEVLNLISFKLRHHDKIYVKHLEKEQWLRTLFENSNNNNNNYVKLIPIVNLDNLDCPNIHTLKKTFPLYHCSLHSGCCALQNIYLFYCFINKITKYT